MPRRILNIISICIIIIPFYMVAFYQKLTDTLAISAQKILGEYLIFSLVGVLAIILLNKSLLKNKFNHFISGRINWLLDFSIGFLLLAFLFFIKSLAAISYQQWIIEKIDRTIMINTINEIFSNPITTVIFLGPFIWLSEFFLVLSRSFILNNLWELNSNKYWKLFSIIFVALLGALLQIDNGITAIINWFLIIMVFNIIYYYHRNVIPLLIAGILFQSIELFSYWYYNF